MLAQRIALLAWLIGMTIGSPALAQQPQDPTAASGRAGSDGDSPVQPTTQLSLALRGLTPGQILRLGVTGSDLEEKVVSAVGPTEVAVEFGKGYDIAWGNPESPTRARFYVPRPAEPTAVASPLEIDLRRGARSLADQISRAYDWGAGENRNVAAFRAAVITERPQRSPTTTEGTGTPAPSRDSTVATDLQRLESRLAAVESTRLASSAPAEGAGRLGEMLAILGIALACLSLAALVGFVAGAWRPHREAVTQALERTLPDALRAQSQETAKMGRRLDAIHQQWEHDRDALRRAQELLAAHAGSGATDALRSDVSRLRQEIEQLKGSSGRPA